MLKFFEGYMRSTKYAPNAIRNRGLRLQVVGAALHLVSGTAANP